MLPLLIRGMVSAFGPMKPGVIMMYLLQWVLPSQFTLLFHQSADWEFETKKEQQYANRKKLFLRKNIIKDTIETGSQFHNLSLSLIMEINTIVVCGAGTMGSGIAQAAAQSGHYTLLYEVNAAVLEKARSSILKNLELITEK